MYASWTLPMTFLRPVTYRPSACLLSVLTRPTTRLCIRLASRPIGPRRCGRDCTRSRRQEGRVRRIQRQFGLLFQTLLPGLDVDLDLPVSGVAELCECNFLRHQDLGSDPNLV